MIKYELKIQRKTKEEGAAIAQWIRLRLPSCGPRIESQAHHLRWFHLKKIKEEVERKRFKKVHNRKRDSLEWRMSQIGALC